MFLFTTNGTTTVGFWGYLAQLRAKASDKLEREGHYVVKAWEQFEDGHLSADICILGPDDLKEPQAFANYAIHAFEVEGV